MRSNSGSGKSNNLHDPTLREAERAQGKSGEAPTKGDGPGKERAGTTGTSTRDG